MRTTTRTRHRRAMMRPLAAAAVAALVLTACGTDDDPTIADGGEETEAGDDADDHLVAAIDNDFDPDSIEVSVGDTVEWSNEGGVAHTVTFDDVDSGNLDSGETFARTFDEPGEFDYVCTIHAGMDGTVTVTG